MYLVIRELLIILKGIDLNKLVQVPIIILMKLCTCIAIMKCRLLTQVQAEGYSDHPVLYVCLYVCVCVLPLDLRDYKISLSRQTFNGQNRV